ncbi:hypothetical protein [Deinococcus sp. AB2017081]|nr:hypothetical protein [Deinococcus sp. AB2017081]WQE94672.1 hypothetical protein U2P90_14850 [Deinococcus sp. AB2017081]
MVPLHVAVSDGWLPDTLPATLDDLRAAGYIITEVEGRRTARSRGVVTVPVVALNAAVARAPWHSNVQVLGLAMGRRRLRIPADRVAWFVEAHVTVRRTNDRQTIPGVVADARWHEKRPDAITRSWYVEYSSGSYSRARLKTKILAYGPNPQVWLTGSDAHADVIRDLIADLYPGLREVRVRTVDWTAGWAA